MAAELAGGAVLGTALSELCKGVRTLTRKSTHFKRLAKDIELRLECLLSRIKEIEDQNMKLHNSNQCTEKFKTEIVEGLELVRNCSKVGPWNIYRRFLYTKELRNLDGSLEKWLDMLHKLDGVRDEKEILQSARTMEKMMLTMFVVALGILAISITIIRESLTRCAK